MVQHFDTPTRVNTLDGPEINTSNTPVKTKPSTSTSTKPRETQPLESFGKRAITVADCAVSIVIVGLFSSLPFIVGFSLADITREEAKFKAQYVKNCEDITPETSEKVLKCLTQKYDAQVSYAGETNGVNQYAFRFQEKSDTCHTVSPSSLDLYCENSIYPPLNPDFT